MLRKGGYEHSDLCSKWGETKKTEEDCPAHFVTLRATLVCTHESQEGGRNVLVIWLVSKHLIIFHWAYQVKKPLSYLCVTACRVRYQDHNRQFVCENGSKLFECHRVRCHVQREACVCVCVCVSHLFNQTHTHTHPRTHTHTHTRTCGVASYPVFMLSRIKGHFTAH